MKFKKIIADFEQLNNTQLYDILKLRQDVFIIEQNCFYEDIDNNDDKATHLLIYHENKLAAYSRLFAPNNMHSNASTLGRIIVRKEYRSTGLGKILMEESILWCHINHPKNDIVMEAQALLQNYYTQYGFGADGDVYVLDGIEHIMMRRKI